MKTLDEILDELNIQFPDDFYDKMAENWDDGNDAIFIYNLKNEKAEFDRIPKYDAWYPYSGKILLARMSKPCWKDYEISDLFDEVELYDIERLCNGDWSRYLSLNPDYSLEERVENASRNYFETNWSQYVYNEMEDKLMEAQKEVSNDY